MLQSGINGCGFELNSSADGEVYRLIPINSSRWLCWDIY